MSEEKEAFQNLFEVLDSQGSIKTYDELSDIQSAVVKDLGGEIILWRVDKNQKFTKNDLKKAFDAGKENGDSMARFTPIDFEEWYQRTFPVLV
jgi:hypothetical protein